MSTISFLAQLDSGILCQWNCFSLTYDLDGFKSRINRHLLTVGSFEKDFLYGLIFFLLLFLVTPCLVVAVQPWMEWIPILKTILSLRLTSHIHRTICMSVREILLVSLSFRGQTWLPYSIALSRQAFYNFPLILCESTLEIWRGKRSLNFFQPDLARDNVLASTPPPALSSHQDSRTD